MLGGNFCGVSVESVQESGGIWAPTLVAEGDEAEHTGIALNPLVHMEASKFQMRFATLFEEEHSPQKVQERFLWGGGPWPRGCPSCSRTAPLRPATRGPERGWRCGLREGSLLSLALPAFLKRFFERE